MVYFIFRTQRVVQFVVSLNIPSLYVLKIEYVEMFFNMENNTSTSRYSKIEYFKNFVVEYVKQ